MTVTRRGQSRVRAPVSSSPPHESRGPYAAALRFARCRQTAFLTTDIVVLGATMKIDPQARSSMSEDLQRGRRTEIDYLQGAITEIETPHAHAHLATRHTPRE